jgi:hypothetical protein
LALAMQNGLRDDTGHGRQERQRSLASPRVSAWEAPAKRLAVSLMESCEVGALLGSDRYTEAHAAFHRGLGREVTLVRLRTEYAHDEVLRERFRRSAEVLRRVRHPSVICLHRYVDATGALLPLAEEAGISLPAECVLGAVALGERSLVRCATVTGSRTSATRTAARAPTWM